MFAAKVAVVIEVLKPTTDKPFGSAVGIGEALENEVVSVLQCPSSILASLV